MGQKKIVILVLSLGVLFLVLNVGSFYTFWVQPMSSLEPTALNMKMNMNILHDHDHHAHQIRKSSPSDDSSHKIQMAGLNCDKYGGPSQEVAAEMVYWSDIPSDATYTSPFANYGPKTKYLTFEPDEGGWNNIRMSMETAVVLALAMGRTLVIPPTQPIYLLWNDDKSKNNRFTFKDFFHFDTIMEEHPALQVITMEQFLKREAMTGRLKDKTTGAVVFPPRNKTDWDDSGTSFHLWRKQSELFWQWFRNAVETPIWDFSKCMAVFGDLPGPDEATEIIHELQKHKKRNRYKLNSYDDNPTPVNAPPGKRMMETLAHRNEFCVYGENLQNSQVVHFMGDNASGARLLTHFYTFLFFKNWHQDLWTKRFVRDHLRYIDEIQCAAARVVSAVRQIAKENGDPDGIFDSFHIRRGDFQYKETRIEATDIYNNIKDVLVKNSTVFVATDERNMTFFEPLGKHYNLYFLHDFQHLIQDVNKNYFGMLDQRVASRGRTFVGAYFSSFTGYINRMRGYHSQKDKLPGYRLGALNSYYYVPEQMKDAMRVYKGIHGPTWAREFPAGWRDIDHDVDNDNLVIGTN